MRLAKGDVTNIYQKNKQNEETIYRVNLSSLSLQDTFIQVKQRIKAVLDFVIQAENLKDTVPQVLSERFKFRKAQNN